MEVVARWWWRLVGAKSLFDHEVSIIWWLPALISILKTSDYVNEGKELLENIYFPPGENMIAFDADRACLYRAPRDLTPVVGVHDVFFTGPCFLPCFGCAPQYLMLTL